MLSVPLANPPPYTYTHPYTYFLLQARLDAEQAERDKAEAADEPIVAGGSQEGDDNGSQSQRESGQEGGEAQVGQQVRE